MMKKILRSCAILALVAACSGENGTSSEDIVKDAPSETSLKTSSVSDVDPAVKRNSALIDQYLVAYKDKDIEVFKSLHADGIISTLYPDRLFTNERSVIVEAAMRDFENRPKSYLNLSQQYQVASDIWVTFGTTINGEQSAPIMVVFDVDEAGEKFDAIHTKIGATSFIRGPSVTNPTPGMLDNFKKAISGSDDIQSALAPDIGIYAYPPAVLANQRPFASGTVQAAEFLNNWGKGALQLSKNGQSPKNGGETFISRYMQYVFVGVPGPLNGVDRVALFTLGADPDGDGFEKITRVDIMGPSGE